MEVAHRYLPAGGVTEVGGDWFDVIPLSGSRVALVVGDVVGHGVPAAATMGRLRTAVHTLAGLDLEPDEVLSQLDDLVGRIAGEQEGAGPVAGEQIVGASCLYAVYDPISRHCSLARAGHPPPVVVTPDGRAALAEMPAGPPLGLGACRSRAPSSNCRRAACSPSTRTGSSSPAGTTSRRGWSCCTGC